MSSPEPDPAGAAGPASPVPTDPPRPWLEPDFDPLADLLQVLDLVPERQFEDSGLPGPGAHDGDAGAAGVRAVGLPEAQDVFVGRSQPSHRGHVFGGQVLAQAIIAAGRTVRTEPDGQPTPGPERLLHSLHAYFLRAGDDQAPLRFEVERLRDGRSFSARRVHAIQFGRPILSTALSFQLPADGLEHQATMPAVPAPEDVPTTRDRFLGDVDTPARQAIIRRAIDLRHCEGNLYGAAPERAADGQHVWMRAVGPLPDDPLIHAAILAYASDYTILETVLRRHRMSWTHTGLRAASLDHAMWFHRPVRMDDWVLYDVASPAAGGGRGLGLGRVFDRAGTLVASVAQEGMLRLRVPAG